MSDAHIKPRIAVIGAGISGLTCAYLLRHQYQVHLFEANDYAGGHTQTTDVEIDGQVYPVNTGFIVFNDRTYPNFIRLMDELGVASENSDMSFSVKSDTTGMEYNGQSLNSLFARRRNLLSPSFWRMVQDILRFNRETKQDLDHNRLDPSETLGSYLSRHGYGDYFKRYYIVPMGAAIWSSGTEAMMEFPLVFFLRFFNHHGLLDIKNRPQWKVIQGGSRSYVHKILQQLPKEQVHIHQPVTSVQRDAQGVRLRISGDQASGSATASDSHAETVLEQSFDQVIFACHSDQALALLEAPTAEEQRILGAIPYQSNEVVLHTDASLLPNSRLAWASWNYHLSEETTTTAAVTYHMNRLQNFHKCPEQLCVTLNRTHAIREDKILRRCEYSHPVFTLAGMEAQQQHHRISGANHSHFAGAYWFNGFHEDGVVSALRVCKSLGVTF